MKRVICLVAITVLGVALQSPTQGKARESMIVSTEWLAKHLGDESLVLFHVGEKAEYDAAHIPGAQFIQPADLSTPRGQGLSLELPPVEQLKATLERFGLTAKSRVVIYFGKDWVSPTARIYFVLDYLGLGDRTSILDGGLPAWVAENQPVTTAVKTPTPGNFTPRPNPKLVVDAAWVSANLNKPGVAILDARNSEFYTGAQAGTMPRAGRIPGAKSIPFSSLIEDSNKKFKSPEALRQIFNSAGVKQKDNIATYCHIGQQASLLYFVAQYLGYEAHLYDGSFQDWSNRKELPVEKTETHKTKN